MLQTINFTYMDQIPYSEGLRHCCPPDHISRITYISHITYSMEYGVWNRDYDLQINGIDHLVAFRKLIHPRRQETEKITHKKTALQP